MPNYSRAVILAAVLCIAPLATYAQTGGATVAFGSLKGDPTLPVEVTSDTLNVNQADGAATFVGNVQVVQGEMRMTAPKVRVEYAADTKAISSLHATGGVTIFNGAEAAESQEAVYTINSGTVVMTGQVLLTQGTSAISGNQLTVDLNTGTGVMEGRVQTVFVPGSATP
jgi:lipopolysaccharide export system protein LptA